MAIQATGGPVASLPIARGAAAGSLPVRVRGLDRARTSGGLVIVLELIAGTGGFVGLPISPADRLRVERELDAVPDEGSVYETLAATIRTGGGVLTRVLLDRSPSGYLTASLEVAYNDRRALVDCPPTDAVLLATRRGTPLFASESALAPTRAVDGAPGRA